MATNQHILYILTKQSNNRQQPSGVQSLVGRVLVFLLSQDNPQSSTRTYSGWQAQRVCRPRAAAIRYPSRTDHGPNPGPPRPARPRQGRTELVAINPRLRQHQAFLIQRARRRVHLRQYNSSTLSPRSSQPAALDALLPLPPFVLAPLPPPRPPVLRRYPRHTYTRLRSS